MSLFTHYLVQALGGEPKALDTGRLTISSIFDYLSIQVTRAAKSYKIDQRPTLKTAVGGVLLLGDFSTPLIAPESLELGAHPIETIDFEDSESERTKTFLANIKNWGYSAERLERRVNDVLGERYEDHLGRLAARLSAALGMPSSEISVEGATLLFPGGMYSVSYEIDQDDKKSGVIRHCVSLSSDWFSDPARIAMVLNTLSLSPTEMILRLSRKTSLERFEAGLNARGWRITSLLSRKIEASLKGYVLVVEPDSIRFSGFTPDELFGDGSDPNKIAVAGAVLALLPDASTVDEPIQGA